MTAPRSAPRPPTATQMAISMDGTMPIMVGEMIPTCGVNSAPATPAMPADSENTSVFSTAGS